ncbi:sensor domain-containing protein, partial [Sphaerisporangium krabiense]
MDERTRGGAGPWWASVARRAWRELAYASLMPVMAGIGLVHLVLVSLSLLTTLNLIGVPLLALSVRAARGLGAANLGLARALAGVPVPAPPPLRSRPGLVNRFRAVLGDVTGWRAVVHGLTRLPAAALAVAVAAGTWGCGLLLLCHPLWWRFTALPSPGGLPGAVLVSAAGLILLLLAPWCVHVALAPERALARALLGPAPGDTRIRRLEQARAMAVDDAVARLRRVERDLHDGTAARLVTLALSLGMVQEELEHAHDPERL